MLDGRLARRYGTTSQFGAVFDSATDRAFFLSIFAGLALSGRLGAGTTAVILIAVMLQTGAAVVYMSRRRDIECPKTLLGTALGALLLVRGLDVSASLNAALELAAMVVAADSLWFYARPLWSARTPRRLTLPAQHLNVVRNYQAKLTSSCPHTTSFWTIPNAITLVRLLPAALGIICVLQGRHLAAIILGATFVVLDMVDGFLARHIGQVSTLGARLDPVIDKLSFAGFAVALTIEGRLPGWALLLALGRITFIGLCAGALVHTSRPLPRNWWSAAANLVTGLLIFEQTGFTYFLAIAVSTQNLCHYGYVAGQTLLDVPRGPLHSATRDD